MQEPFHSKILPAGSQFKSPCGLKMGPDPPKLASWVRALASFARSLAWREGRRPGEEVRKGSYLRSPEFWRAMEAFASDCFLH